MLSEIKHQICFFVIVSKLSSGFLRWSSHLNFFFLFFFPLVLGIESSTSLGKCSMYQLANIPNLFHLFWDRVFLGSKADLELSVFLVVPPSVWHYRHTTMYHLSIIFNTILCHLSIIKLQMFIFSLTMFSVWIMLLSITWPFERKCSFYGKFAILAFFNKIWLFKRGLQLALVLKNSSQLL
jgi:hypothetical protein